MKLVQETGFKGSPINLLLSMKVNEEWNWTHQAPGTMGSPVCPNTAYDMGTALRRNPFCRVLFFGGIHDAATPFWNVKHSISKMFLPESITSRIEYKVHENGTWPTRICPPWRRWHRSWPPSTRSATRRKTRCIACADAWNCRCMENGRPPFEGRRPFCMALRSAYGRDRPSTEARAPDT